MGPILQQLVTLAGVLLGAGSTFAATTYIERSKWRRSFETRWDDMRLTAYSEYADALKAYLQILYRYGAEKGLPNLTTPADEPLAPNVLAEANAARSVKWERVLLLGSSNTIAAARRWHKAAHDLTYLVFEEHPGPDRYVRLYESMGSLRDDFYVCARADLGVRGGSVPTSEGAWLPPHQAHLLTSEAARGSAESSPVTEIGDLVDEPASPR
ncbi:hypothetical protein [Nocardia sp. NBC_00416]|uniref:hypothetical protein n=1 Tax=Nocardia sp. NBC_00416 TaxID=2975991 RepID=UPI002E224CB9